MTTRSQLVDAIFTRTRSLSALPLFRTSPSSYSTNALRVGPGSIARIFMPFSPDDCHAHTGRSTVLPRSTPGSRTDSCTRRCAPAPAGPLRSCSRRMLGSDRSLRGGSSGFRSGRRKALNSFSVRELSGGTSRCFFRMQQLTVRLKLLPDDAGRQRLLALIGETNECCNWISQNAWLARTFRRFALHHLVYQRAREAFGIGGYAACGAIAKVAHTYAVRRSKAVRFRPYGAILIHKRMLAVRGD